MPQFITIQVPDRFDDKEQTTYDAVDMSTCIHRATRIDRQDIVKALKSFCSDIEAAYRDQETGSLDFDAMGWPDLKDSYLKAKALLEAIEAEEPYR